MREGGVREFAAVLHMGIYSRLELKDGFEREILAFDHEIRKGGVKFVRRIRMHRNLSTNRLGHICMFPLIGLE